MVIAVWAVSHEKNKYYAQFFSDECLYKLWMLEYDRIHVSEGIDVNKIDGICECIIRHYWYLLDINFRFAPKVCNDWHDLMQKVNDVAIVSVKRDDYRIHFWYMSKDESINLF